MQQSDRLCTSRLCAGYARRTVLDDVTLSIPDGCITALVGPNGSGKSTLLRCLAGLLKPERGAVTLDAKDLPSFARKELARQISFLPQSPQAPEGINVEDLVRQGRYPHQGFFSAWNETDDAALNRALTLCGLEPLRTQALATLSGGQRQRAWIAMSIAQEAGIMLLDEPTNFLDLAHQLEVLQLLRRLSKEEGKTIIVVLHDLNHALNFADYLVVLEKGAVQASGTPRATLTAALVQTVFAVKTRFLTDPKNGTRHLVADDD